MEKTLLSSFLFPYLNYSQQISKNQDVTLTKTTSSLHKTLLTPSLYHATPKNPPSPDLQPQALAPHLSGHQLLQRRNIHLLRQNRPILLLLLLHHLIQRPNRLRNHGSQPQNLLQPRPLMPRRSINFLLEIQDANYLGKALFLVHTG
ncbi:hypothetical protein E4U23_001213 [Claviceps purpurea]|nr:hypothetical protein E4U23_001213 [Claviceps purpurea]